MRYAKITPTIGIGGQASQPFILGNDAIARGPGSRYIVAGWPGVEQIVQNIQYLDQAFNANLPWGNRAISFSLVCEYEFDDEDACFLFVCRLPQILPMSGLLEMGTLEGGGVRYPFACIRNVSPVIGATEGQVVSTRLRYDIDAGRPVI